MGLGQRLAATQIPETSPMYRAEIYRLVTAALIVAMGVVSLFVVIAPVEAGVLETPAGGFGQAPHDPVPTQGDLQIDGRIGSRNLTLRL